MFRLHGVVQAKRMVKMMAGIFRANVVCCDELWRLVKWFEGMLFFCREFLEVFPDCFLISFGQNL